MGKKWLFVDFDNTLMATEQYAVPSLIARFNTLYAQQIGRELTFAEFKQYFHGQAREMLCENLSKHFNIHVDYPLLYDAREWRIMQHYQQMGTGIEMAPNAIETLTALSQQGFELAIVTNNPIQRAFTAMRFASNGRGDELARLFGHRYFEAGDVQKPKPDVYLRAMAQLNAKPEHSFAIEDSLTGVKSAVAAGLTTFAFSGFGDNPIQLAEKLIEGGCTAAFSDWREFPSLLIASSVTTSAVLD